MIQPRKRNSSKVNLTISIVFHSLLIGTAFFFAAREGLVGKKMQALTATLVPKEKKPEPPKAKPVEPKIEPPRIAQTPKPAVAPPPRAETASAPPPAATAPAVAPAEVNLPAFQFSDGAKQVETASDPDAMYKALVEYALRSRWDRPDGLDDARFVAEVELNIDSAGDLRGYHWLQGSGNSQWDDSVKAALAQTKAIGRPPPKGFPDSFKVRFDVVQADQTETPIQLTSR